MSIEQSGPPSAEWPELIAYRAALAAWLVGAEVRDRALRDASARLCHVARAQGIAVEALIALSRPTQPRSTEGADGYDARISRQYDHRHMLVTDILLMCYYDDR